MQISKHAILFLFLINGGIITVKPNNEMDFKINTHLANIEKQLNNVAKEQRSIRRTMPHSFLRSPVKAFGLAGLVISWVHLYTKSYPESYSKIKENTHLIISWLSNIINAQNEKEEKNN